MQQFFFIIYLALLLGQEVRYFVTGGIGFFAGPSGPGIPAASSTLTGSSVAPVAVGTPNAPNDFLKATQPALLAFLANLPTVEGPSPDVDFVLSICLQSNIPTGPKAVNPSKQLQTGPAPSTSDLSGSSKPHPVPSGSSFKTTRDRQSGKRKDRDGQDDDTATVQSQPLPRDLFKIRQLQKARGAVSQTGSTSYGSAFSGELSGSTG